MLGTTNLTSGEDFDKLPDTHVIFILEYDLKNQGLPAYQVKRTFLEDNSDFDDGTRFIFVNEQGTKQEKIEIAKNMLRFEDPLEKIVLITGLTLQQVQNIQHSLQSPM